MAGPALPSVAARSLAVLVSLLLMCTFGLTPGQQHVALAEIVSGLIASVLYAWVLLIEILR